jgi:hypothetical protein
VARVAAAAGVARHGDVTFGDALAGSDTEPRGRRIARDRGYALHQPRLLCGSSGSREDDDVVPRAGAAAAPEREKPVAVPERRRHAVAPYLHDREPPAQDGEDDRAEGEGGAGAPAPGHSPTAGSGTRSSW